MDFLSTFIHQTYASSPLFLLIIIGYALVKWRNYPKQFTDLLSRFLFNIAIPVMLFRIMANFYTQPAVDIKLLLAFFGGSFIVFLISRIIAKFIQLNGVEASVFGLGGIFSNNVMLGIPLATIYLGEESLPAVALVISFNALLLWSLVSVSVEWAQTGSFSLTGIRKTVKSVLRNPIVIGVMLGLFVSLFQRPLPLIFDKTTLMISQIAAPLSLIVLGMGLAEYRITDNLKTTVWMTVIKLFIHPLIVWSAAILLGIPPLETAAIVLLASMAMGMNVYLMARQFKAIEGPVASSLLISTALSALTTPLLLAFL